MTQMVVQEMCMPPSGGQAPSCVGCSQTLASHSIPPWSCTLSILPHEQILSVHVNLPCVPATPHHTLDPALASTLRQVSLLCFCLQNGSHILTRRTFCDNILTLRKDSCPVPLLLLQMKILSTFPKIQLASTSQASKLPCWSCPK